ncbi:hypothetical protein SI65_05948 [Aspergillus cristatus]|uniref:Prolyl 4-hydroxylase alpha subunit domain-containing protein n=1 Tax=Aspergillus cristatus TaxID=573508 RepID=A0A1E3BEC5_ASPCR|nr:hypothetical protein SI65_05948 [Aspergillus cristatus]
MPFLPNASTVVSWIFYLIPIYIFVLAPLLSQIFPPDDEDTWGVDYAVAYDAEGNEIPALNLEDDSFISPEDDVPLNCPQREPGEDLKVHILSRDPLVIYIENFLTEKEADHLVDVSVGRYTPSIIYDGSTERIDPSVRLSDRALLARDETVRCVEDRARAFQGWRPHLYIERMWAQRYNASGHYRHHFDWAGSAARGGDRVSTFMVYLAADCVGGGTNFPKLGWPGSRAWCRFLECDDSSDNDSESESGAGAAAEKTEGITFKPIKGNAIFWENLRADGRGISETWHGALPVKEGTKVGLNIWSWYQPPRRRRD